MEPRESILNAAEALFAEKGYDCTPILEIANLVGVSSGTIIYHFKQKESLLAELAVRHLRKLHARCQDQASQGVSGLDSVLHYVDAFYSYLQEQPQSFAAFYRNQPRQRITNGCEMVSEIAAAENALAILLQCLILVGMNDSSIPQVEISSCSRTIQACLQGGAMMVIFQGNDAGTMAREAIHCTRLLLSDVASNGG